MKKRISSILLVIVFLAGLSLLLYPSFSDYWNSFHQTRIMSSYVEQVADLDEEEYETILESARTYNAELQMSGNQFQMTQEEWDDYATQLNPNGSGVMGYVEIPLINCKLPIYHGTDESVLQVGVGHLEWSSLPVGGEGNHAVLSGHRGLPSARLFSNLDQLRTGDTFTISILDEVLTYEVDQILIVEPTNTEHLRVEAGRDYCTLMTCTPYGVNSHRLLVRGHRIANAAAASNVRVSSDATQLEPLLMAPLLAIPIILVLVLVIFIRGGSRKKSKKTESKKTESNSEKLSE